MAGIELDRRPSAGELRWFGVVVGLAFGVLGAVVLWQLEAWRAAIALWSVGLVLAGLCTLVPGVREPLHFAWMRAVFPIAWAVSHLLLALIFFGVITPIGVVLRGFGRDALARRVDRSLPSYWVKRDRAVDTARYFRQS